MVQLLLLAILHRARRPLPLLLRQHHLLLEDLHQLLLLPERVLQLPDAAVLLVLPLVQAGHALTPEHRQTSPPSLPTTAGSSLLAKNYKSELESFLSSHEELLFHKSVNSLCHFHNPSPRPPGERAAATDLSGRVGPGGGPGGAGLVTLRGILLVTFLVFKLNC